MIKKHDVYKVIKNNKYLLKLYFSEAPLFTILYIINVILNELTYFLVFTLSLNYVLESVEYNRPFLDILLHLVFIFLFLMISLLFDSFLTQKIQLIALPRIKKRFKELLYDKVRDIDLESYDNPDFYNDFILTLSESDRQIDRVFLFIKQLISSLTVFITAGAFFISKDSISLIFIAISLIMSFILTRIVTKLSYQKKLERNPEERRRKYVNRIFYLNEYAKEMRMHPEMSEVLLDQLKTTSKKINSIDKTYAGKFLRIMLFRDYFCNHFISNFLYITYLVYKAAVLHYISYSNVVVLYNLSGRFKNQMTALTNIYPYAEETSLFIERINQFLQIKPRIISIENRPVPQKAKQLELKNVTFAYDSKHGNILQDINMVIPASSKIAIVGDNGAGKTTLIKLIMRLYDPSEGEILLDGINIKEFDVKAYRDYIGAVFQDYKIYAATIQENVILDDIKQKNSALIVDALNKSEFSQRLSTLEKGIDTNLTTEFEEDGVNLSVGESQKIAIARAFYKDYSLMILDEPLSALDPISEYNFNQTLFKKNERKTLILISHRLSMTPLVNSIYLLENGRIIEQGSHEELLRLNLKYAKMWNVQVGQYL